MDETMLRESELTANDIDTKESKTYEEAKNIQFDSPNSPREASPHREAEIGVKDERQTTAKILISNLSPNVTAAHLKEVCSIWGNVMDITFQEDSRTPCAIVEYERRMEAQEAQEHMHRMSFDHSEIMCSFTVDVEPRTAIPLSASGQVAVKHKLFTPNGKQSVRGGTTNLSFTTRRESVGEERERGRRNLSGDRFQSSYRRREGRSPGGHGRARSPRERRRRSPSPPFTLPPHNRRDFRREERGRVGSSNYRYDESPPIRRAHSPLHYRRDSYGRYDYDDDDDYDKKNEGRYERRRPRDHSPSPRDNRYDWRRNSSPSTNREDIEHAYSGKARSPSPSSRPRRSPPHERNESPEAGRN